MLYGGFHGLRNSLLLNKAHYQRSALIGDRVKVWSWSIINEPFLINQRTRHFIRMDRLTNSDIQHHQVHNSKHLNKG